MPQTPSRTPAQFSLFQAKELVTTPEHAQVPGGLPLWLGGFVREAVQETETLRHNGAEQAAAARTALLTDRKSTRLNSSHLVISYAVFCLKKKKNIDDAALLS